MPIKKTTTNNIQIGEPAIRGKRKRVAPSRLIEEDQLTSQSVHKQHKRLPQPFTVGEGLNSALMPNLFYNIDNNLARQRLSKDRGFQYTPEDAYDLYNTYTLPFMVASVDKLPGNCGVYTRQSICLSDQPVCIGRYKGESITLKNGARLKDESYAYCANGHENVQTYIDARKQGNWTRFINHSTNPNVAVDVDQNNNLLCYLVRDVKAGEQLLVNYGENYDFGSHKKIFLNSSDNWQNNQTLIETNNYFFLNNTGENRTHIRCLKQNGFISGNQCHVPYVTMAILENNPALLQLFHFDHSLTLPLIDIKNRTAVQSADCEMALPIHIACAIAYKEGAEFLLALQPNCINDSLALSGLTPTMLLIKSPVTKIDQKMPLLEMLIEKNANLSLQDKSGYSAAHWCVLNNEPKLLDKLLAKRGKKLLREVVEADHPLHAGMDPCHLAIYQKNVDCVSLFFRYLSPTDLAEILLYKDDITNQPVLDKICPHLSQSQRQSLTTLLQHYEQAQHPSSVSLVQSRIFNLLMGVSPIQEQYSTVGLIQYSSHRNMRKRGLSPTPITENDEHSKQKKPKPC